MNSKERKFVNAVWGFYKQYGRHDLPWRKTTNTYRILVSEIMLQQTQAPRVVEKYKSFLKRFPTVKTLSKASLGDVLREWQGLGYNRRAKMLHRCAEVVVKEYKGKFPKTYSALVELPAIGNYTAGAVMAFSYNEAVPIIETNIRTVFIHHFFYDDTDIPDSEIMKLIERTLDSKNPREWYFALMDYGTHLKKTIGNLNSRSKHYNKQSPFKNSDRQIRGGILKLLTENDLTRLNFHKKLPFEIDRIDAQLEKLTKEGMIIKNKLMYSLPH